MKIDKLNINGKKEPIDISDKIIGAKINNKLVSNVLYKTNANCYPLQIQSKLSCFNLQSAIYLI